MNYTHDDKILALLCELDFHYAGIADKSKMIYRCSCGALKVTMISAFAGAPLVAWKKRGIL